MDLGLPIVAVAIFAVIAFFVYSFKKSKPVEEPRQTMRSQALATFSGDFALMIASLPTPVLLNFTPAVELRRGNFMMPAGIALDEGRMEFIAVDCAANPPRYKRGPWSKIASAEVRQNQQVIAQTKGIGALTGAVGLGLVAGPAGAIVGAVAGRKRSEISSKTDTDLYIHFDDLKFPSIKLPFGQNDKEAFEWLSRIETVIRRAAASQSQAATIEQ